MNNSSTSSWKGDGSTCKIKCISEYIDNLNLTFFNEVVALMLVLRSSWWAGPFQRCRLSDWSIVSWRFCFSSFFIVDKFRDLVFFSSLHFQIYKSFRDTLSFFFPGFQIFLFLCVTWPLRFLVFLWLVWKMQILSDSLWSFVLAGL